MTAWERTNRPKPPRLAKSEEARDYYETYPITAITRSSWSGLWFACAPGCTGCPPHDTHAEAVHYAHKLAYERSQS